MLLFLRRYFPLVLVIGAFVAVAILYYQVKHPPARPAPPVIVKEPPIFEKPAEATPALLSPLADPPDWKALNVFQNTITHSEFEKLLSEVFTIGDSWKNFVILTETNAIIQTNNGGIFNLSFATTNPRKIVKPWRSTADLSPAPADQPLEGLHIAIDPGHIGGEWAKMEERWFIVGEGKPVCEGDMTLAVAKLLKPKLEALGAKVSLVRDKAEPVTPIRPEALTATAEKTAMPGQSAEMLQKLAERLFYRTAEIHDRAQLVNNSIKPDLVLCLHFNAEGWGDPKNPTLVPNNHFHLILNGAYSNEEFSMADQRFAAIHKILEHTHEEEAFVGSTVGKTFAEISKLPPYQYLATASAKPVKDEPFLWCRNLLANRLYDCPVIYVEPYVMNSTLDYARIQAGDYEGLQEILGEQRPSIFREYADALAEGLRRHYSTNRPKAD